MLFNHTGGGSPLRSSAKRAAPTSRESHNLVQYVQCSEYVGSIPEKENNWFVVNRQRRGCFVAGESGSPVVLLYVEGSGTNG